MTMAALWLLGAYLIGSIPAAFLIARHAGRVDLRTAGSGNLGATNVLRTTGPRTAAAVVGLDILKGACVVLMTARVAPGHLPIVAGVTAVVGHVYPVWLRFRGGKGVATAFGVFCVLAPVGAAASLICFAAMVWMTRYVSLGSIIATIALGPFTYVSGAPRPVVLAAFVTSLIVLERHRVNVARLRAGTENRVGQRV
jgi:glycerol-3-phosphate acyltransferase PlsY